jgi:hypothetical protein
MVIWKKKIITFNSRAESGEAEEKKNRLENKPNKKNVQQPNKRV